MASKSYGWGLRNIAESSPDQKTASYELFTNFSNTVLMFRTKFSTVILHHITVLCVQWHQNRMSVIWQTAKSSPEITNFFSFFTIFSNTVLTIRTKLAIKFLHHIRFLYVKVQWYQIRTTATKKQNQSDQETAKCEVQCFQKTSKQSNKVLQSFHVIPGSSLCYGFKIEKLGFEKQSKSTKKDQKANFERFSFFAKMSLRFARWFPQSCTPY